MLISENISYSVPRKKRSLHVRDGEKKFKISIANFEKPLPSIEWRNTSCRLGEHYCDRGKIKVFWDIMIRRVTKCYLHFTTMCSYHVPFVSSLRGLRRSNRGGVITQKTRTFINIGSSFNP